MLTTSCPKCEKEVTVPAAATAASRVRCPLCSEEYTLESVFADLPPLLELLDAPATNGAVTIVDDDLAEKKSRDDVRGPFDFERRSDDGEADEKSDEQGDIALADAEDIAPKSSGFDFGDDATPAAASVAGGAGARTAVRPRRKQASPVKMIVGVILGGLLAAPVAQLILWWLPGDWGIERHDPFSIAQDYPGSLGLLAPAKIRNYSDSESRLSTDTAPEPSNIKPPPPTNIVTNEDDTTGGLGRDDLDDALKNGNSPVDTGDDVIVSPPNVGDPPDLDDPPKTNQGGNKNGSGSTSKKPPAGVKDAPTFTTTELSKEIQATKDALPLLDEAVDATLAGPARKAKATEFVATASRLAEAATFAEDRPVGHREHLDALLAEAGESHDKRRFLGALANLRLKDDSRDGNGIIVAALVKEVRKQGQLYETVMEIDTTDNPPISVYGPKDPQGAFAVGDMVVLLGVIVDDPKQNIRGYQGPPDPVIWGGYSQVVAAGD